MARPPSDFFGFMGQRKLIKRLKGQLYGAQALAEVAPHLLLMGPSGIGKTALARAVAYAMRSNIHLSFGHDGVIAIATKLITDAKAFDVVFVDEAHAAPIQLQEFIMAVIDTGHVPSWAVDMLQSAGTAASRPGENNGSVLLPPLTFVLATDQPGRLLPALASRFSLREALSPYSSREMRAIVDRMASTRNLNLSPQARNAIAAVCGGLPRAANHHLANLRRDCAELGTERITVQLVQRFLRTFGIDDDGIDVLQRKALHELARFSPTSGAHLARVLGVDETYLARGVEPLLIQLGLIRIGVRGRELTKEGRERLQQPSQSMASPPPIEAQIGAL